MSTTIDNRVLEMRFDNKQFESGVATTMSTLDKLKQKLNLSGAAKGFDEIDKSAKKVDFSGMSKGIETVQAKFSALQVAGVTALANLTNSAVNAGKRIASALTIDPIKTGFQEYETQIGAIQTILANTQSKGSTLQDVNRALDELNTYADKTIYNFTEMTRNIGTFTAAGVDLDKSVTSIKGIANLAAVSGSTSQQASTAMYQLSQALAAGRVSLMDWNSVVNAGMGGELFQNALKRTAKQMGHDVDAIIEKYGSFRESLTQGEWLTTEVLTETLTQLSGAYSEADLIAQGYTESQAKEIAQLAETAVGAATEVKTFTQLWDTLKESVQSGWTQSWETIVGDFGEAKELLTGISNALGDMIQASSDARNKVLTEGLSTGWKQLLGEGISDEEGFKDSIKSVAKEHGVAVDEMINKSGSFEKSLKEGWLTGDILAESLDKMTQKINGLSAEQLKEMGYTSEQVEELNRLNEAVKNGTIDIDEYAKKMSMASGRENMITGFKNIFDSLLAVIKPINEAFREIFPATTGEQLYKFTENFREFTETLKVSEETAGKIKNTFKGLFAVLDIVVEAFKAIAKGAFTIIGNFTGIGSSILDATSSFGDFLTNIRDSVVEGNIFGKVVDRITGFITTAINKIKEFVSNVKEIGSSLADAASSSSILESFLGFFQGLWNVIKNIGSAIAETFGSVVTTITDIFGAGDIFEVINSGLFAGVLLAVRNFIKGITNPIEKLSFLEQLQNIASSVQGIFDSVRSSLEAYQQNLKAGTLLKIAGAIGILAASLWVVSTIDSDKLAQSLGSIGVLFGELVAAMTILGKLNSKTTTPLEGIVGSLGNISRIVSMIGLSAAVLILAGAMKVLADLDWEGVAKGLAGVAGLVTILVAAAKLMNTNSKSITKFAGQMVVMSAAVAALSLVAKELSSMSWEELAKGGAGVFGIVTILVTAAKVMDGNSKSITKFAGQMIIMSAAVGVLTLVGKEISSMSWTEIAKGGAGIVGIITILVAAAKIMDSNNKTITKFAGQIVIMSAAVAALALIGRELSSMSWEELAKGGASIFGLVAMLVAAAKIMSIGNGSISKFGIQMLMMSAALKILVPVLQTLGSMSWNDIGRGLITLGAALAELAIGLKLMNGSVGGSAALLIAAAALSVLAPVLQTLGSMSIGSIVKSLVTLAASFAVIGIASALLSPLIPTLLGLATAFALFGVATFGIGAGLALIAVGITAFATSLAAGATAIVAGLGVIVTGVLGFVPTIARIIGESIVEIARILGDYAPQLAESFLKLIANVAQYLADYTPQIVDSLLVFLIGVINSLADHMPELITAVMKLIGALFQGIADALKSVDTSSLLQGVLAVSLMTALMYALAGITSLIPSAMLGLAGVGVLIAELALILAAIGGLAQIEGLKWLIEEGGNLLQDVGVALGKAIGGFIGGIGEGLTDSLPRIMDNINVFLVKARLASTIASGIDWQSFNGISDFLGVLGEIALSSVGTQVADFFTLGGTAMDKFGKDGVAFFEAMRAISESATGITVDEVSMTAIINVASKLAELQSSLDSVGGVIDWFTGRDDLGTFGKNAATFISSMAKAFGSLEGTNFNIAAITTIIGAAKALSDLQSSLEPIGGVISWFSGRDDLGSFGQNVGLFISSIAQAFSNLDGVAFNIVAINTIIGAAKALSDLQSSLEPIGGVISWFTGRDDLGTFGVNAGLFMSSMAKAFSGLDGDKFDTVAINTIIGAAKALSDLQSSLEPIGGVISWFTGRDDLGTFGENIGLFIISIIDAFSKLDGVTINQPALTTIISTATKLADLQSSLDNVGGVIDWFTGRDDLGTFGENAGLFINSMAEGFGNLSGVTINLPAISTIISTAVKLSELQSSLDSVGGVIDWFTGRDDLGTFGVNAGLFINSMSQAFGNLKDVTINQPALTTIISTASKLAELQSSLDSVGGVIDWFTGRDDLGTFGVNAGLFMTSMANAFGNLKDVTINLPAISTIIATAVKLADLQSSLESVGGVIDWFTGRDDLGTFGENAGLFITSMAEAFGNLGDTKINQETLTAIISTATKLADLQSSLDSVGGVIDWFTGRDDLGTFGLNAGSFITSMINAFGNIGDVEINQEALTAIISTACKLSELQSSLESVGGVIDWFTGRDDLGTFGLNAGSFITSMINAFGNIGDVEINEESLTSIISSAGKLASLQSSLENVGGVISWFTGRSDLGTFGVNAGLFMSSMANAFGNIGEVEINQEAITAIISTAGKLADIQSSLESVGGVIDWFTGRDDLGTFGVNAGQFISSMASAFGGLGDTTINEEALTSIINGAFKLADLVNVLPEEGWFDGKMNLTEFSDYIKDFSTAISDFSANVSDINSEGINTAISAANQIKNLINSLVGLDTSGVAAFTGIGTGGFGADGAVSSIAEAISDYCLKIGDINTGAVSTSVTAAMKLKSLIANLAGLDTSGIENFKVSSIGSSMKSYSDKVSGIESGVVASSISSANRLKNFIAGLAGLDTSGISNFKIGSIGSALKSYSTSVAGFNGSVVSSSISAATKLKNFVTSLTGFDGSGVSSFVSAINELGTVTIDGIVESFSGASTKMLTAGSNLIESVTKGMKSKQSALKSTVDNLVNSSQKSITSKVERFYTAGVLLMTKLVNGIRSKSSAMSSAINSAISSTISSIRGYYNNFYSAGTYLGSGLVLGINSKQIAAYNAGYALGRAAVQGEKDGQASNSPSKLTIQAGKWLGEGLVVGIEKMGNKVYDAGHGLGDMAANSMSRSIAKVSELIDGGIDAQPTIRPVLDLSDVTAGAASIGGLFGETSFGVTSNLSAIGSMMNRRNQNGTTDDVISAINKLRKDLGNTGNTTYNLNGITYDDGSNIAEAVQTLVRAAIVERRI